MKTAFSSRSYLSSVRAEQDLLDRQVRVEIDLNARVVLQACGSGSCSCRSGTSCPDRRECRGGRTADRCWPDSGRIHRAGYWRALGQLAAFAPPLARASLVLPPASSSHPGHRRRHCPCRAVTCRTSRRCAGGARRGARVFPTGEPWLSPGSAPSRSGASRNFKARNRSSPPAAAACCSPLRRG